MGQQGPPGAKKRLFSKMILDHMECQNKCFWHILSPWWPVSAPPKSQNALKMGSFEVKNGSTMCLSKNDPRAFGVHKQVKWAPFEPIASHFGPSKVTKCIENGLFLACFDPVVARFGPPKIPKCLENGLFWDKKWFLNWSKMCFSKNDPTIFGVPKQVK